MSGLSHRTHPCAQCPWRVDVHLAPFSDADMTKLARANGCAGAEAAVDAPAMSCHLDQPGTPHETRLCAGWLAVVGRHHLVIRMAIIAGRLPEQALSRGKIGRRCARACANCWPTTPEKKTSPIGTRTAHEHQERVR